MTAEKSPNISPITVIPAAPSRPPEPSLDKLYANRLYNSDFTKGRALDKLIGCEDVFARLVRGKSMF